MTNVIFCHFLGAGDPSLLGHHDDTNNNDDEHLTVYTHLKISIFSVILNFQLSKNMSFLSFPRGMKGMRVAILDQRVVLAGGEESLTNSTDEVLCECAQRIV